MDEIKRKRGRPKLTPEQKAEREAFKKAQNALNINKPKTLAPPTAEEQREMERVMAILERADAIKRQQVTPPTIKVEPQGSTDLITIARAKEVGIEDEPRFKPQFIRDDERGWSEIP